MFKESDERSSYLGQNYNCQITLLMHEMLLTLPRGLCQVAFLTFQTENETQSVLYL